MTQGISYANLSVLLCTTTLICHDNILKLNKGIGNNNCLSSLIYVS